jgi:hypothetical protein
MAECVAGFLVSMEMVFNFVSFQLLMFSNLLVTQTKVTKLENQTRIY